MNGILVARFKNGSNALIQFETASKWMMMSAIDDPLEEGELPISIREVCLTSEAAVFRCLWPVEVLEMIEPTIGRIVWFHPAEDDAQLAGQYRSKQFAALIVDVHSNHTVTVTVFGHNGYPFPRENIRLVHNDKDKPADKTAFCEWMPYQKGQAAKTDDLQKQLQRQ